MIYIIIVIYGLGPNRNSPTKRLLSPPLTVYIAHYGKLFVKTPFDEEHGKSKNELQKTRVKTMCNILHARATWACLSSAFRRDRTHTHVHCGALTTTTRTTVLTFKCRRGFVYTYPRRRQTNELFIRS